MKASAHARVDEQESYQLWTKTVSATISICSMKSVANGRDYYTYLRPTGPSMGRPLRAALGKENLGQRVTEVLRPYN